MHINNSRQTNSVYKTANQNSTETREKPPANSGSTPPGKNIAISRAGKQAEKKWQDIAARYDVTHMTVNERNAMVKELYDNKLINGKDFLMMTTPISINDALGVVDVRKRDFLATSKFNFELSRELNNNQANSDTLRRIDFLQRLADLRRNYSIQA